MIPLWFAALIGLVMLALGFWRGWMSFARTVARMAATHEDTCPARRPSWLYCSCYKPPLYVVKLRESRNR